MIEFLSNKYTRWYLSIVATAKYRLLESYSEVHHIVPMCIGGGDNDENKVRLTAREHFICHFLLTKMLPRCKERNSLVYAASMMALTARGVKSSRYAPSSKTYEAIKIALRESMSGVNSPLFGKKRGPMSNSSKAKLSLSRMAILADGSVAKKISAALRGKDPWNKGKAVLSDAQKKRISEQHKGKIISNEQRKKISAALIGRSMPPISEETRQRMRDSALARERKPMPKRGPMSEEQKLKLKEIALSRKR